jgi:hypothetical protein
MARLRAAADQPRNAAVVNTSISPISNISDTSDISNISSISSISSIPVRILRGFFSGVGQLLLAADRFREVGTERQRYGQDERFDPPTGLDGEPPPYDGRRAEGGAQRAAPGPGRHAAGRRSAGAGSQVSGARRAARPRGARRRQAARPVRFRSLDATGNVRILTPDMPAETPGAAKPRAASRPSRKTSARSQSKTTSRPAPRITAPEAETTPPPTAPAAPATAPADLPLPGYDGLSLASIRARLRGLDTAQLRELCEHEKSGANRADVVTMLERRIAKLEAAGRDAT